MNIRAFRLWRFVWANLQRSRNHFLLAAVGIVVGIATFTFFMGLGIGVREIVLGQIFPLDQLEVTHKTLDLNVGPLRLGIGNDLLDDEGVAELAEIPGVEGVYPKMRLTVPSIGMGGRKVLGSDIRAEMIADGLDPSLVRDEIADGYTFSDLEPEGAPVVQCTTDDDCDEGQYCGVPPGTKLPANRAAQQAALATADKVCRSPIPVIVSHHLVELYNGALRRAHGFPKLNPNAVVGLEMQLIIGSSMVRASNREEVIVERARLVGYSNKAISLGVTMPVDYVKRFNVAFDSPDAAREYHSAIVTIPRKDDVASVAKAITDKGLELVDSGAEQAGMLIAIFMGVFGLISAVIVAIAAINIMHVFFMLVVERQHEIGIMRAVGASRLDVVRVILGESAVVGGLSGGLGVLLAMAAAALCDRISKHYIPDFPYKPETYFAFPWWLLLAAIGFSIAFCVIGAFLPARRAARMEPAAVLSGH